jgi:pyridoxamine 5'-phosphate oxidase
VEQVSAAEADAYFKSRARESQLGAWASQQSEPLESPAALKKHFQQITEKYEGQEVPRPAYWSGWRVKPMRIEFWQEGKHRLHERMVFTRDGEGWTMGYLNP